jgi:hypothetical protein
VSETPVRAEAAGSETAAMAHLLAVRDVAATLAGLLSIAGDGDGERARFSEGEPAERVTAVRALWDALDEWAGAPRRDGEGGARMKRIEVEVGPGESVVCPNCGGTGKDPETMVCVLCGGEGLLEGEDDGSEGDTKDLRALALELGAELPDYRA